MKALMMETMMRMMAMISKVIQLHNPQVLLNVCQSGIPVLFEMQNWMESQTLPLQDHVLIACSWRGEFVPFEHSCRIFWALNNSWSSIFKSLERSHGCWIFILNEEQYMEACWSSNREETYWLQWVFKTKYKSNGNIDKYKLRLIAKAYA